MRKGIQYCQNPHHGDPQNMLWFSFQNELRIKPFEGVQESPNQVRQVPKEII